MRKYYSQHGEDYIVDKIFRNIKGGFFVEIGCIDGRRFSNTLVLEKRGWKGICIEAHPDYIGLLKRNRPNSIVIHAAVGEADQDEVNFYANSRGSLSTLDKRKEIEFKDRYEQYFTGFEVKKVKKRRLDTILSEFDVKEIHVMSLDIEGYESQALKGLNLDKYRPNLFVIEADSNEDEKRVDQILIASGYYKGFKIACNLFYFSKERLYQKIKGKIFLATLSHTEHPLDHDGDQTKKVVISIK
jgi:FkbM family methyltransferase